ncbi:hypothetical protein PQO03_05930 [Lentisphaera profundi]|uniref:Uncharacterized protein n=1 Tax=Lentisphaera profundi TaxID=1658616 RepID=A0ABY7VPX1_9BACT|nr:hypothetical protein [Lentisphaera profundi]WDE95258.1 hypothetical protein PQO03_05930 [Lentisphaera profundi]
MSNHKQLGLAVAMYGNDLRGYLPWYKAGDANNARAHAMYFTLPIYVNGGVRMKPIPTGNIKWL